MSASKAKIFASVRCDSHGDHAVKNMPGKFVKVPLPKSKRERYTLGCPHCKK